MSRPFPADAIDILDRTGGSVPCLIEADAKAYIDRSLKFLRRLDLPWLTGPTGSTLKPNRYYPVAVLDAWLAENGTYREEAARRASRTHTRYRLHNGKAASAYELYETWRGMLRRCSDSKDPDYFGRGITVYQPWVDDPVAFYEWVEAHLGDRPEGHTLDRVDNDGNYEPGNLRWADASTQNGNRRSWHKEPDEDWFCGCSDDCQRDPKLCPVAHFDWPSVRPAILEYVKSFPADAPPPPPPPPAPQEDRTLAWDLLVLGRDLDDLLQAPS